jgi:hypothetical protein
MKKFKASIQISQGFINGTLQALAYVKRPNQKYRTYRLTRSSARRIKALKGIILN